MAFVGRKPTNAPLTSDDIPNGIIGAADLATGLAKLTWDTTAKTSGFTASANTGYFCNTTSAAFTVTLPSTPTAGDSIQLVDYAGTWDTNNLTINPNSNKILGQTSNVTASKDREAITLIYIDSTQGWLPNSGYQESTGGLGIPYSVDFLVIAGGGGGGGENYSGGGGAGGYRTSTQTVTPGTVITVTVGDGGAAVGEYTKGNNGSNSSISGSGLTTITSTGGGGGGSDSPSVAGSDGGSGGGSTGYETSTLEIGSQNGGITQARGKFFRAQVYEILNRIGAMSVEPNSSVVKTNGVLIQCCTTNCGISTTCRRCLIERYFVNHRSKVKIQRQVNLSIG